MVNLTSYIFIQSIKLLSLVHKYIPATIEMISLKGLYRALFKMIHVDGS